MTEHEKAVAWDALKSAASDTARNSPNKGARDSANQMILLMVHIEEKIKEAQH